MKKTALLLLVSLLAACSPADEAEKVSKEGLTKNYHDPASVQYRNVINYSPGYSTYAICGELNGKNSYGAYVGFKRFVAVTELVDSEPKYRDGSTDDDYLKFSKLELFYCHNRK